MPKNQSGGIPEAAHDAAYRYANSRPFTVFGLAAIAALGTSSMVWGAWSVLSQATHDEQIASPPDLKVVIDTIKDRGHLVANTASQVDSESSEGESSFSGKDADDEQAVDESV